MLIYFSTTTKNFPTTKFHIHMANMAKAFVHLLYFLNDQIKIIFNLHANIWITGLPLWTSILILLFTIFTLRHSNNRITTIQFEWKKKWDKLSYLKVLKPNVLTNQMGMVRKVSKILNAFFQGSGYLLWSKYLTVRNATEKCYFELIVCEIYHIK